MQYAKLYKQNSTEQSHTWANILWFEIQMLLINVLEVIVFRVVAILDDGIYVTTKY